MKHSAQFWVKDKEIKLCSPDLQMLQASMARFAYYDPMVNLFKEVIIGDGRIIDVGACIGAYSLLFHYAKPNSEIIALEPSSHNYAYLMRNTMHIPQIKQYELAASDRTETLTLSIPSVDKKQYFNMGMNNCGIISSYGDTDLLRNDALAIRLDDLVDSASFIKIDAEGHDYPVLLGAQRLLADERPVVQVEYNQATFDMSGFTAENISTLFTDHKYTVVGRHAGDYIYIPIEKVPEGMNKIMSRVVAAGKGKFVIMDAI